MNNMVTIVQRPPTFLAPGTSFMEDNFSTDWGNVSDVGDGSGSNESDGERWGAADEASLARPPLTSCCAARFLTGRRLIPVHGRGLGTTAIVDNTVSHN